MVLRLIEILHFFRPSTVAVKCNLPLVKFANGLVTF